MKMEKYFLNLNLNIKAWTKRLNNKIILIKKTYLGKGIKLKNKMIK
jgi:hypothetical protein